MVRWSKHDGPGMGRATLRVAALCVAALTLLLGALALGRTAAGGSSTLDFSAFYTAGHLVREGLGDHLYDINLQESVQRELSGGNYDEPLPFAAPAFVAFAVAPLTGLPLRGAFVVMLAVNVAALTSLLIMLRYTMTDVPPRLRTITLAATAIAVPTVGVLTAGQTDLLVAVALLGGALLLRSGRPWVAGAVLAMALAKPQLAIGAPLLLLATRDRRPLASMAFAGALLALVPAAVLGTSALTGNWDALDAVGRPAMMANWRGMLASLGAPDELWIWGPGWAAIAATALFLSWRVWRRDESTFEQRWALAFALPLLVSPHLHGQSLVLALPALALFLQAEAAARPGRSRAWEERAESLVLGLFILLLVRWTLALAGISFGVLLLGVLFVAIALPERWRLLRGTSSEALEQRAA